MHLADWGEEDTSANGQYLHLENKYFSKAKRDKMIKLITL